MLYELYETQRSMMEPFADLAEVASRMFSNPALPFAQRGSTLSERIPPAKQRDLRASRAAPLRPLPLPGLLPVSAGFMGRKWPNQAVPPAETLKLPENREIVPPG